MKLYNLYKDALIHSVSVRLLYFKERANEFYLIHLLDSLLILLVISIRHNPYFHI
jgi:hypothetical protein